MEREIDLVSGMLRREYLSAMLERELGNAHLLDEWVEIPGLQLRRHPRGLVLHNLAGNALIVTPLSISFGLLTKNCNLVKVPSDEPFFAATFARILFSIAPELTEEFSVLQWDGHDEAVYANLFPYLDGVVHWGGEESHRAIAHLAAEHDVALISHGPKISFGFLDGPTPAEIPDLAAALAQDVVLWEQRACASLRFVLVGPSADGSSAAAVAEALAAALADAERRWPPGNTEIGKAASVACLRQRYSLHLGLSGKGRVLGPNGSGWTVVLSDDLPDSAAINHCMDRFVWVSPVTRSDDVLAYLERGGRQLLRLLQVMVYHGRDQAFIDAATRLGVARVSNPGETSFPAPGASHDGGYNLTELTTIHSAPRGT